jgi:hypothetical protein
VAPPTVAVQVDERVADHQGLPWRVLHASRLQVVMFRRIRLLGLTGIE